MISEKRSMTHTERRKPYDFFMKHFLGIDLFSPQDLDKLKTIDRQIVSRKFSVPKKLMTIAINCSYSVCFPRENFREFSGQLRGQIFNSTECDFSTHRSSGLKRCRSAQNARPSLHDEAKSQTWTSLYPSVCCLHHNRSASFPFIFRGLACALDITVSVCCSSFSTVFRNSKR